MIAVDVLGGCNEMKKSRPCKQGELAKMAVTVKKALEKIKNADDDTPQPNLPQLVDAENNLPLQQSMVERASREAFICPFCDAPCQIILDATAPSIPLDPGEIDQSESGEKDRNVRVNGTDKVGEPDPAISDEDMLAPVNEGEESGDMLDPVNDDSSSDDGLLDIDESSSDEEDMLDNSDDDMLQSVV